MHSARRTIEDSVLPVGNRITRRNRFVPIKVNTFIWRLALDRLPTRCNLDRRGIDLPSLLCPICDGHVEEARHLFFSCQLAMEVWGRVERWLQQSFPMFMNMDDVFDWIDSRPATRMDRIITDTVCLTALWVLWTYRNAVVFGTVEYRKQFIFDNIVSFSFIWFSRRNSKTSNNWTAWLQCPIAP